MKDDYLDQEPLEDENNQDEGVLFLITVEEYYDLLMEQQEQM
jgi:hypothetical protein